MLDAELIDSERPDLVIQELVARSIQRVPAVDENIAAYMKGNR